MEKFSDEEKKILQKYCTNLDQNVYGLINLPEVVAGALFSRYSRSDKSAREILLKEFIQNPQMRFDEIAQQNQDSSAQIIATQKAEEFYDRVLVGYGDDSVAELGGARLAIEEISNIATKFIQDSRIGLSPLEKSTRYVYFDKKNMVGEYNYYKGKEIIESKVGKIYKQNCDMLFETYSTLIKEVFQKLTEKYPPSPEITKRAYESTIKAKTCDILRGLLPASTLTNMGIYGNGRAWEYLLTKMYACPLVEINKLAEQMYNELIKIIPSFVKRVKSHYGQQQIEYIRQKNENILAYLQKNYKIENSSSEEVELIYYDKEAEDKILWAILFEFGFGQKEALEKVKQMTYEQKAQLLKEYAGERKNRRHRPYRAFEFSYYTFALCANFGQYRDIHRHRILTQVRQALSCNYGYDISKELIEFGFKKEFEQAMKEAKENYEIIKQELGEQLAQYSVPMAYKIKWYINLNLREAFHLIELRSSIQGHPDYRRVVLKMYEKIKSVHPLLAELINHINFQEVELERLESEKKIDKKLENLKKF
ncbi:MAG: FAD-dependent thymidylate synthase [Candidatus Micrarchaeota archaeon]|nr:FAD-dependent thymidylate synthase [Candidatus Micrarchaeota archaeon]